MAEQGNVGGNPNMPVQNNPGMGDFTTTTTTTEAPTTSTTTVGQDQVQASQDQPATSNDKVDKTSILRGKKINPRTGTQTTDDDETGVQASNVHNETQVEQAAHTLVQTTEGAEEVLANTISAMSAARPKDGNRTAIEAKPTKGLGGPQNDGKEPEPGTSKDGVIEEVHRDGNITQGETGGEKRDDLSDLHGGGSGSNIPEGGQS